MSQIAKEYVLQLRNRFDETLNGIGALREEFRRNNYDRKPPEPFEDSSYLYVRSFDQDQGVRPFTGITFWNSPDITLSSKSNPTIVTTDLVAGRSYNIQVILRNRGDLAVPSAKVELFLTDPSIGFDTRFATRLTNLTNIPSAWVGSGASESVNFQYTVPSGEAGHKCLFARCFSFSPLDLPFDDFQLDPRLDRHVAQKNLSILAQGDSLEFLVFHLPTTKMKLRFEPLKAVDIFGLRHPILGEGKPFDDIPNQQWAEEVGLKIVDPESRAKINLNGNEADLVADQDGPNLDEQRRLYEAMRGLLARVAQGDAKLSENREMVKAFRAMSKHTIATRMRLKLPNLGLQKGQIAGVHLIGIDMGIGDRDPFGGVTLLIR
jgi:hypothetical protein